MFPQRSRSPFHTFVRMAYLTHRRGFWSKFHHSQNGTLGMANVVAVTLCCALIVFVINVGHVGHEKVEMQNSADAVAYSGAVWQARGMNSITATNHVIGEITSLVIVHEAIGGKLLDEGGTAENSSRDLVSHEGKNSKPSRLRRVNRNLDWAYRIVSFLPGVTPLSAYHTVREHRGLHAEATLLDAKVNLKETLTWVVYTTKGTGRVLQLTPWTRAAGEAMERGIHPLEMWIKFEYEALNILESAARGLRPIKYLLRDHLLPVAKRYTDVVVWSVPWIAQQAAEKVARRNDTQGTLFPVFPRLSLPVCIDPHARAMTLVPPTDRPVHVPGKEARGGGSTNIDRDQIVKITQLARATFPWVCYHRQPIISLLSPLWVSRASSLYKDHTDGYSKRVCSELQLDDHDLGLYVIKDYPSPDKGFAAWTDDPAKADKLFSVIGLAYRPKPRVIAGAGVFKQQHKDGRVTYAQALIYNANTQELPEHKINLRVKRIRPNRQADVGWDTLNWKSNTRPTELCAKWDNGGAPPAVFPEIEVNWQAKLVPGSTTRLQDLSDSRLLPAPFRAVVSKMLPDAPGALQTH